MLLLLKTCSMIAASYFITVQNYLTEYPLFALVLASLLFYLPLILENGVYHELDGSPLELGSHSLNGVIGLWCTLAFALPLLFDILLDIIGTSKKPEYLGFRCVSMLSMSFGASVSLAYSETKYVVAVGLTTYQWAYFLEFSVILCLLSYLVPDIFTIPRIYFLAFLQFVVFMGFGLNCISTLHDNTPLGIIIHVFFYIFMAVFMILIITWMRRMHRKYRASNLLLVNWVKTLTAYEICAFLLMVGVSVAFLALILILEYVIPNFSEFKHFDGKMILVSEALRVFTCFFTYILPSRIFREELLAAQRTLETKTELVKYFSHELRSPISALDSGLKLLEAELNPMKKHVSTNVAALTLCRDLKQVTESAEALLDDLLMYEKIEAKTIANEQKMVHHLAAIRMMAARYTNVVIHPLTDAGDEVVTDSLMLNVDCDMVKVAFGAILGPACGTKRNVSEPVAIHMRLVQVPTVPSRLMPRRPWRISPDTVPLKAAEPKLRLIVSILDCYSERSLMELAYLKSDTLSFERAGRGNGKGSGFSLWIASKLVQSNGGTVTVRQADGGIVFELDFPVFDGGNTQPLNVVQVRSPSIPGLGLSSLPDIRAFVNMRSSVNTSCQEKALTLLIVDDSGMVRKMTRKLMEAAGHTCHEAEDGVAAIDAMRAFMEAGVGIDAILMDNQMPRMMGLDATKVIRDELRYKGVVIGVTGNACDEDIQLFVANGADEVIIKPLKNEKFNEVYKRHYKLGMV